MKKATTILATLLLVMVGCRSDQQPADDLITVDVTKDYPKKELILQDFMDVEYIPLETSDEFITKGSVKAIGKDFLLVTNQGRDGDIFVFDRAGKGLRKINRFGQGAEEYSGMTEIVLDEDKNEMFVEDFSARKILVYDLSGNFKRSFKFADTAYYNDLFNYNSDHLICYKSYSIPKENEQACHVIISKQDGSITREIRIPSEAFATPVLTKGELTVTAEFHLIFPNHDNWALVNTSSDTVYNYLQNGNITPFMARNPSIHTMETQIFLFPTAITDRYTFMRTMKKELDFKTFKGFPSNDLVYDKQEKAVFQYTINNEDFSKREVIFFPISNNPQIAVHQSLEASDLIEANEKGLLSGKLKEIATKLDEEANPVIMLVKYKK